MPIAKHSNQNHVIITFYSHLKTVLPATTYNATFSFPVDSINVILMTQECFEIILLWPSSWKETQVDKMSNSYCFTNTETTQPFSNT